MKTTTTTEMEEVLKSRGYDLLNSICDRLKVPRTTVWGWIKRKKVSAYTIGNRTWALPADVEKHLPKVAENRRELRRRMGDELETELEDDAHLHRTLAASEFDLQASPFPEDDSGRAPVESQTHIEVTMSPKGEVDYYLGEDSVPREALDVALRIVELNQRREMISALERIVELLEPKKA